MGSRAASLSHDTGTTRPINLAFDAFDLDPEEVRSRFRRAHALGTPAWLWPEISSAEWREACEQIARVAQQLLAGSTAQLDGDPLPISLAAYTSGMGPLLGWWSSEGRLRPSGDVGAVLQLHFQHNRLRSEKMRAALDEIKGALARNSIAAAVLKGMHTGAVYFPDPATRPASDIDILIAPDQAGEAESTLIGRGYRLASRSATGSSWRPEGVAAEPRSLLLVHADDPWTIDLHTTLDLEPAGGVRPIPFDRFEPLATAGGRTGGFAQPLLLLHLAAHASVGLHNLSLLRLVELQFVIRRDAGKRDWDALLSAGRYLGALGFAWPALKLCEDLAPGAIPDAVLAEMERAAPAGVRRIVEHLTPATAQRLDGVSVREHFMWSSGFAATLAQLAADLRPSPALKETARIYERRIRQLVRGRISR